MSNEKDIEGTLYHIRVKGNLDPKWADWFEGFALASGGDGETLLRGKVADQAALHGTLSRINRLGLSPDPGGAGGSSLYWYVLSHVRSVHRPHRRILMG